MKRITTGRFDSRGNEIFLGDKVLYNWGWFTRKGKVISYYKIHTINQREDGSYALGDCFNHWKGSEVVIIDKKEWEKDGPVPENTDFFLDPETKKVTLFTDQHFMNLNDEEWELELKKRRDRLDILLFGK